MSVNPGEEVDEIDQDEIKKGDVTAEEQHGNNDDERGIRELFEAADPLVPGFPRPRRFLQLGANFAEEIFCFRDHGVDVGALKPLKR